MTLIGIGGQVKCEPPRHFLSLSLCLCSSSPVCLLLSFSFHQLQHDGVPNTAQLQNHAFVSIIGIQQGHLLSFIWLTLNEYVGYLLGQDVKLRSLSESERFSPTVLFRRMQISTKSNIQLNSHVFLQRGACSTVSTVPQRRNLQAKNQNKALHVKLKEDKR